MKAVGACVLVAVILNLYLGSGLGQQHQGRARGRQNNVSWREAKDRHVRIAPLVNNEKDLKYYAEMLKSTRDFEQHLDNILIPRVSGTPGNVKVRKYIGDTMRGLNWHVENVDHEQNTPVGKVTFDNVIATLDPEAPRRLVLACHYDSKLEPAGFLGATDSAVPCAQLLNLAHAMDRDLKDNRDGRNEVTLQFIFFDGEEAFVRWTRRDSTYGSRNLASTWESKPFRHEGVSGNHLHRMDVMVLLDLIGASNPTFHSTQPKTQKLFERMIRIENDLRERGSIDRSQATIFAKDPQHGANVEDDHIPFMERGVPILHMITLPFPKVWHTAADDRSAVNVRHTENISKILRVFVAEYLQMTRPELQNTY